MSTLSNRLNKHFVAAAAATVAVLGAQQADAAVVWSGPVNINIPSTTSGIYLNVVSGISGPSTTVGWDVNPWSSGALNMFSTATQGTIPGATAYAGTAGTYFNLAPGTLISGASTFGATGTNTINAGTPLNLNSSNNLVGFRFVNEANGNQQHFGWMRISLSGTAQAQPRAIVEYAYESVAGVGLLAGVVPGPGALALLGLAGLVSRRRRA